MKELAIGFFDGVHLGHQKLLHAAASHAREMGGTAAAFTFDNHPATIFAPTKVPPAIMTKEDRLTAIRACGIDHVVSIPFTTELAALSPADFATYLRRLFPDVEKVYCGPDWTFGHKGLGTPETLAALGFAVETIPFAEWDGEKVSSTRIRRLLQAGDIINATHLLGKPYHVTGKVFAGKGEGRKLGFPTVNLSFNEAPPIVPGGVYGVEVLGLGMGLANWGCAPTLGEAAWKTPVLEIHLSTPPKQVPAALTIFFKRFIRPEKKFASLDDLKCQLQKDREFFSSFA